MLFREYSLPMMVTVLLHAGLVVWLAAGFTDVDTYLQVKPKTIKASLVTLKTQAKKIVKTAKKPSSKKRAKRNEDKEKVLALKNKKASKLKQKKRLEAQRLEKKRLEKERLKKERQRQERLRKQQQKMLENTLLDDLEAEERLEQERVQQRADEVTATSYMAAIKVSIESNWSRPPNARNGMKVTLQIELVPTGAVVGVHIINSSGNDVFDSSAVAAVEKSERFDDLAELELRVFEQYYRRFRLIFNPEDLRL